MILEACVGNLIDAISAQSNGAHQVELCTRLDLDGNSPSITMVKAVTAALDIPVKVIVNPKPYDYFYSQYELDEIVSYILAIQRFGIAGIVFGPVDAQGMPDLNAIAFISGKTSLPITFHKSIDDSPNILVAIQSLIDQNIIRYILTSGGKSTALIGAQSLLSITNLIEENNSSIQIIGAGSITKENLPILHDKVGLKYYHGKLIVGKI